MSANVENEKEKMESFARVIFVAVLTATLVGSALGRGAAQAAQPAWRTSHPHALLQWSSRYETRHASQGGQTGVATWFRTSRTIHHAVFRVRLERPPYTPTPSIVWGTIRANHWYRLSFTVLVPLATPVGRYAGSVRLTSADGDHDRDDRAGLGRPVVFVVQVLPKIPTMPTLTWTPAGLGTFRVHQGQLVTETVSFMSSMPLTNAAVVNLLNRPHVHIAIMSIPTSVAAHTAVPVTFTISADPDAPIAVHPTDLHVVASFNGSPLMQLARDLDFAVDVERAPRATITWMPASLGVMTVHQGETVTKTASFVSNMNLSSVQLAPSPRLANPPHVHLTVVPMVLPSVTANMAVPVTLTISADANAGITVYHGDLHLVASVNGGPMVRLARDLDVAVDVDRAPTPRVTWPSGSPTSYAALTRAATPVTATEMATFQVTTALSNVALVGAISGHDVTITPAPVASTVAANTPTTISFTITVAPTAPTGTYRGVIWVSGMAAGATRARARHNGLHFVFALNK
jgi:hypothetical protein